MTAEQRYYTNTFIVVNLTLIFYREERRRCAVIMFVDKDGNRVSFTFARSNIGIGVGLGVSLTMYRGRAADEVGITHYSAYVVKHITNQTLVEGKKPDFILGADASSSIGHYVDNYSDTFEDAYNNWYFSLGVTQYVGVEGAFGEDCEGCGIKRGGGAVNFGFGLMLGMGSGGRMQISESISLTNSEAKKVGTNNHWTVRDIIPIKDDNGNITGYQGNLCYQNPIVSQLFGIFTKFKRSGIQLHSGIVTDSSGNIKSDNMWRSHNYDREKQLNSEGN